MYAITLNEENRILRATYEKFAAEDDILVETFPEDDISDYKYIDGEYVYDPLPKPPEPAPVEYVTYDELAKAIKEGVNSYGK